MQRKGVSNIAYERCAFDWRGSGDDFHCRYEAAFLMQLIELDEHQWSLFPNLITSNMAGEAIILANRFYLDNDPCF